MIAQEIMGSVDQNGQLCLDTPLMAHKHSRVKVIVLFIDDEIVIFLSHQLERLAAKLLAFSALSSRFRLSVAIH